MSKRNAKRKKPGSSSELDFDCFDAIPKPTDKKLRKEIDKAAKNLKKRGSPTGENVRNYRTYLEGVAGLRVNQYRLELEESIAAERERAAQRQLHREMSLAEISDAIDYLNTQISLTEADLKLAEDLYLKNSLFLNGRLRIKGETLSEQKVSGAGEQEGGNTSE